ncbi:hypothetical protein H4Q26_000051 [Puccinia striiformis f. sp. tritici PST-130]|nr:hypothetical protein H4Q26_000051 [Puccinia striiformis f. sp. tritici PST-130]
MGHPRRISRSRGTESQLNKQVEQLQGQIMSLRTHLLPVQGIQQSRQEYACYSPNRHGKGNKSMGVEQDIMGNFDLLESFLAGSRPSGGIKIEKGPSEQKGEQLGKAQKSTSSKKPKGKKKVLPPRRRIRKTG